MSPPPAPDQTTDATTVAKIKVLFDSLPAHQRMTALAAIVERATDYDDLPAHRPCVDCGAPDRRPSAESSEIIAEALRRARLTVKELSVLTGISQSHLGRLRSETMSRTRPSLTVAMRVCEALALEGHERRVVLASSNPGVAWTARVTADERADRSGRRRVRRAAGAGQRVRRPA